MCTEYLASLGADVVKIESVQRPDPMRYTVRVDPSVDQWYELGGIFHSANLGKRSMTLNLSDPRGGIWPSGSSWNQTSWSRTSHPG